MIAPWDVRDRSLPYDLLRGTLAEWRMYAPNYFGDFCPLTPCSLGADVWIAWQFNRPDAGAGVVQAFRRAENIYRLAHVQLRGLEPAARYRLVDLDNPNAAREYSGKALMQDGLNLEIPTRPAAVILPTRGCSSGITSQPSPISSHRPTISRSSCTTSSATKWRRWSMRTNRQACTRRNSPPTADPPRAEMQAGWRAEYTCGKSDTIAGWHEKIAFYDSLNSAKHGGFHFWSMTSHQQVFYNTPWQSSFPNFSFFGRYRTNLSYPAFSNCSINDNPGNGIPSNGDPFGAINGHLDWSDNIVDSTSRWEITLRLRDLPSSNSYDPAPDSGTADVTLRRLQAFSVPSGSTVNWENRRNNFAVQKGSFAYNGGLVTIPAVRVYKDSSRLTVSLTP